jgi:hyperosmotically inducible periplasmic protein
MMNSDSNHKIVVGIVLAAVFGVAVSVFAIRTQHENEAARNAPTPAPVAAADQNATDATGPAQSAAAQTPTDPTAVASAAPATAPPPTASDSAKDGVGNAPSDESTPAKSKPSDRADRRLAKARSGGDTAGTRVASASNSNPRPGEQSASSSSDSVTSNMALAPSSSETTASAPAGAIADSQQAPAQTQQAIGAGPGAASVEPAAADSQITDSVKSEIAAAAPNSAVDVTTTNGVVALAGSVSNQDAVDQARQAAQRVPGVKHVDASALTVSNQ